MDFVKALYIIILDSYFNIRIYQMSSSKNAKMIKQITNPPIRQKKMLLKDLFIKASKKVKRITKKIKKRPSMRKKSKNISK